MSSLRRSTLKGDGLYCLEGAGWGKGGGGLVPTSGCLSGSCGTVCL